LRLGLDRELTVSVDRDHPRLAGIAADGMELALSTCAAADVVLDPDAV